MDYNPFDAIQPQDEAEAPAATLEADSPQPKRRPRIWPTFVVPLLGLLLAVVFQVIAVATAAVMMLFSGVEQAELSNKLVAWISSSSGFLVTLACGQIGFAVPTILAALLSPEPFRQRLGLLPLEKPVQISVLTALGSIPVLAISVGLAYLVAEFIPADESIEKFFDQLTPGWGIVFVVAIALSPGFIEEMLWRGYVQRRLLERWRPAQAIGVTTLLFTLAHVMPHAMAVAFPMGLWLGFIAWRVGSIVPTIVCHAFVNGGLNAWRLAIKFGELTETAQLVGNVLFVVIGSICFVLAWRMLNEYPTSRPSQLPEQEADLDDPTASSSDVADFGNMG